MLDVSLDIASILVLSFAPWVVHSDSTKQI